MTRRPLRHAQSSAEFWLGVCSGDRRGPLFAALRVLLAALSAVYCAGLEVYLAAERIGVRRRTRLAAPTISVGNLSSGGTGKTPMTQLIADGLLRASLSPAILSRGHGGRLGAECAQVSDGSGNVLRSAGDVGDEAVAMARRTPGIPVFVGKDRRSSGALAFRVGKPDVFVLDDGFQYWQLARDLDVVLIDARRPFDNGFVLPRGLLREPKAHLRRAGIVVITRADLASPSELQNAQRAAERLAPQACVFHAYHRFGGLRPLNSAAEDRLPRRALPVCGIAQPDSFATLLRNAGVPTTPDMVALPDHAVYDDDVVERLKGKIVDQGADSVVVTEKDAVKFDAGRFDLPVYAVVLNLEIERSDLFWAELMQRSGIACRAGLVRQ